MKADDTKEFIEKALIQGTSSRKIKHPIYSETTTQPEHFLEDCIHAGKISPGKTLLNTEETLGASAVLKWDKATSPCVVLAIEKFIDNNRLLPGKKCDLLLIPEEDNEYAIFAELSSCKEEYREKKEGDARVQLANTIRVLHPLGNPFLGSYVKRLAIFFWRDSQEGSFQDVASRSMLGFTSLPQAHIIHEGLLCHSFRYVRWAYPQPFPLPPSW